MSLTLQEENQQLRDRIVVLERQLGLIISLPPAWRLTRTEHAMFGLLYRRKGLVSREAAIIALYAHRPEDEPDETIIPVFILKIRRKLKPFGIEVTTQHGQGWYLTPENREAARLQIEAVR